MPTALAIRGLLAFGPPEQRERIAKRVDAARGWLLRTPAQDSEDRVYRLLGLQAAGAPSEEIRRAVADIVRDQRADGGWGQTEACGFGTQIDWPDMVEHPTAIGWPIPHAEMCILDNEGNPAADHAIGWSPPNATWPRWSQIHPSGSERRMASSCRTTFRSSSISSASNSGRQSMSVMMSAKSPTAVAGPSA